MATLWKNRALSAEAALRCCEAGEIRLELKLRLVLDELLTQTLDTRTRDQFDSELALVPAIEVFPGVLRPGAVPKVVRKLRGAPLLSGAIILFGADAMSSIVRQTATLEAVSGVIKAVDELTRRKTSDCRDCIRKALWRQTRKQKVSRASSRRRI